MNNNTTTGAGADFARLATRATDHVTFDAVRTLNAVQQLHRRRATRRRRAIVGIPIAAVLAAVGIGGPSVLAPDTTPAAQAYEFAATDAPVIAELSNGVTLSYLPETFRGELAFSAEGSGPAQDNGAGAVVFATDCFGGEQPNQVTICIATAPNLTVDSYLEHNWFRGESIEVNGIPALINGVTDDGASGILFSPEIGMVIEIHVSEDLSGDLREIVAGMALERG